MFARIKKSGKYEYLQIVQNFRESSKTKQRVIGTIGRMDKLQEKNDIETLIKSLSRFSEKVLLVLSNKSKINAKAKRIGPSLIFDRLWQELGIQKIITSLLRGRKFEFNVERAIYLTVLHRLFISGSDRSCERWRENYAIEGITGISLHHLYRSMAFLGDELEDQKDKTPFTPRCNKDIIEEHMFEERRDLFTGLDLVFFDTTTIYFEGEGGESLGQRGNTKDYRPDLKQMVIGAILDNNGKPVCCEMWPGNTADVNSLVPVTDRLRNRFGVNHFCIVADRGMISANTMSELEKRKISYILGARMRKVKEINQDVLSRAGCYREVYSEGKSIKDPAPLSVKEVIVNDNRYIICLNVRQARKDAADRIAIIDALKEKLKQGPKKLIGNKGYRKYLKIARSSVTIDQDKIKQEARFDGKWVLKTNTDLSAEQVALKYKELWQVEQVFKDVKCVLETRPVYHKTDETIRGHVFCSFLALVLRKELDICLEKVGYCFEWAHIKQDLKSLEEVIIEDNGKTLAIRTECMGTSGKVFQSVGVAIPPTIREI